MMQLYPLSLSDAGQRYIGSTCTFFCPFILYMLVPSAASAILLEYTIIFFNLRHNFRVLISQQEFQNDIITIQVQILPDTHLIVDFQKKNEYRQEKHMQRTYHHLHHITYVRFAFHVFVFLLSAFFQATHVLFYIYIY